MPAGYELEAMPKDINLKTSFGAYSTKVSFTNNKILYIRTREQYAGTFPASAYADMVSYYESIYKSDRSRLVLKKKE
jgi:hypothetical protein